MANQSHHSFLPRSLREPRFVMGLPLRMRTILLATFLFLFSGVMILLVSAIIVNRMKDQLVDVAREEVRRTVEISRDRIQQVAERYEQERGASLKSLSEISNDPELRAELHLMSRDGAVLLTTLIDEDGATIVQSFGSREAMRECPPVPGSSTSGILPAQEEGMTWKLEFRELPTNVYSERLPIESNNKTIGFIEYGMMEEPALARLAPISSHITQSLIWMVGLVMVCLGLAIYLIYLANNRHLELERRHNEAAHLASIGTMASGLAHEIRNPLHAMNLHLEATREELEEPNPETPEAARKAIVNVQRQIMTLNTIVSNFMNFALPHKLEKEPVRLPAVVGEVSNLLHPDFEARQINFHRDVPDTLWILADPTALRQVLTNVLLNAAQAVEKSDVREIRLRARNEQGRCLIMVEDSGPGLPAGKEEEIFEVFVSERKGGSGFGLPIARRIMREHEGSITGENRKEGGARFTLVFQSIEEPKEYQTISNSAKPAIIWE